MVDDVMSDDIWQELDRYFRVETRQPGDVTADEIAHRYGIGKKTARDRMQALVESGEFVKLYIHENDRRVVVYRRVV